MSLKNRLQDIQHLVLEDSSTESVDFSKLKNRRTISQLKHTKVSTKLLQLLQFLLLLRIHSTRFQFPHKESLFSSSLKTIFKGKKKYSTTRLAQAGLASLKLGRLTKHNGSSPQSPNKIQKACNTVDGRNHAHLGCIKPYEYWDIYYINWCRLSLSIDEDCLCVAYLWTGESWINFNEIPFGFRRHTKVNRHRTCENILNL